MIKVAIAGCGAIAQKRHAPACSSYKAEQIEIGFFDTVKENADKLAERYTGQVYGSFKELLEDPGVKAVLICVPEKYHCDMAVRCLDAGKHVLCEKPMGMDLEQAYRMYDAREKSGRELAVAFSQRHYSEFLTAKKLLLQGEIGKPIAFRSALANSGVEHYIQGNKEKFYDTGLSNVGNVMLNVGCHRVDLITWLLERQIQKVWAYTPALDKRFSNGEPISGGDTAMVTLQLEGGIAGTLWASWCNYGGADAGTEIFGTGGSLKISSEGRILLEKGNGAGMEAVIRKTQEERKGYQVTWNFLDFLSQGKPVEADADAGLKCMKTLDAIDRSGKSGTWETVG